ncbi:hypothetical protein Tco_0973018 [Tanacetum coccineum]
MVPSSILTPSGGAKRMLLPRKLWPAKETECGKKVGIQIEELARYEDEGWNDLVALGGGSVDYENPDIEQLLGAMECKVDTLMKEAISLMRRSERIFGK